MALRGQGRAADPVRVASPRDVPRRLPVRGRPGTARASPGVGSLAGEPRTTGGKVRLTACATLRADSSLVTSGRTGSGDAAVWPARRPVSSGTWHV